MGHLCTEKFLICLLTPILATSAVAHAQESADWHDPSPHNVHLIRNKRFGLPALKVYIPLHPTEHNFSSERAIGSQPPFPGPPKPSNQHPEPAFSDNSPYLGDSGIVFLCAVAPAIPTGAPIHRSAAPLRRTAAVSDGSLQEVANNSGRVSPTVLPFSPTAAASSSGTSSRFSVAAPAAARGSPGYRQ